MSTRPRAWRRALIPLVVAVALVARVPLRAEDAVASRLGDFLESLRAQAGIPGMQAAIVGRNGLVWDRGFGYADVARAIVARPDTPMQFDGLTETFTTTILLRCVDEGRLSLDDLIGKYSPKSPDAAATIRQVLTHTSPTATGLIYSYRPERFEALTAVIRACTGDSFRETLANMLDQVAMVDSVPGPDVLTLEPPAEGIPSPAALERYDHTLQRLALPYTVDAQKRVSLSQYSTTTLTPTVGLISTVQDFAQFDTALRNGFFVRLETLGAAWHAPVSPDGAKMPHGMGWFVQSYNGENLVWQFGAGTASSSMVITVPGKSVTFIIAANSNGLAKGYSFTAGDVTTSPFARAFLGLYVP